MNDSEFILARKSQLPFYRDTPLYRRVEGNRFVLYKRSGQTLDGIRVGEHLHPIELFIKESDRIKGLQEAQKEFNRQLEDQVRKSDPDKVREALVTIVEETLSEPRSGSLEGFSNTMDVMVSDYCRESGVVESLIGMARVDYTTIVHCINVMAFSLGYAFFMRYSRGRSKELGLCALLHDVGKTQIDPHILIAPRRLTESEFDEVKKHPTLGYEILSKCSFDSRDIAVCALDHHETIDGNGYPEGKTQIPQAAQIIGIIDSYEALTNDDRPYRRSASPYGALSMVGAEVQKGRYDKEIFESFVRSLSM